MNKSLQLLFCSVLYTAAACAQTDPSVKPATDIEVRHQSGNCGSRSPELTRLHSPEALAQALSGPARWSPSADHAAAVPTWRDTSIFIQLSAGQQNQGGYRFSLDTKRFDVTSKDIILYAQTTPPDPDKLHTQKIDHPCLIAEIRHPPSAIKNVRVELNRNDQVIHLQAGL